MSISYNLSNVGTYYPIQGMLLVQQQPCIVFEDERKIVSDWISMQQPIGTVRRLQIEFGNNHCAGGCPRCIPKDVYGNCATKEALFHCSAVQTYWKEILKDAANGISHGRFVVEKNR